jgi:hypothetical protein
VSRGGPQTGQGGKQNLCPAAEIVKPFLRDEQPDAGQHLAHAEREGERPDGDGRAGVLEDFRDRAGAEQFERAEPEEVQAERGPERRGAPAVEPPEQAVMPPRRPRRGSVMAVSRT